MVHVVDQREGRLLHGEVVQCLGRRHAPPVVVHGHLSVGHEGEVGKVVEVGPVRRAELSLGRTSAAVDGADLVRALDLLGEFRDHVLRLLGRSVGVRIKDDEPKVAAGRIGELGLAQGGDGPAFGVQLLGLLLLSSSSGEAAPGKAATAASEIEAASASSSKVEAASSAAARPAAPLASAGSGSSSSSAAEHFVEHAERIEASPPSTSSSGVEMELLSSSSESSPGKTSASPEALSEPRHVRILSLLVRVQPVLPELVVDATLLLVAQYRVRLADLDELLLGLLLLVLRHFIGMVLERELPVRRLDVLGLGRLAEAEDGVVVIVLRLLLRPSLLLLLLSLVLLLLSLVLLLLLPVLLRPRRLDREEEGQDGHQQEALSALRIGGGPSVRGSGGRRRRSLSSRARWDRHDEWQAS
mmetsp:Transcript_35733/g.65798  ORF Transcript_35733/g.65798 Transcript_35733/m.65798 type:complete len:414 (+) Transcript_35733:165-1406(+)